MQCAVMRILTEYDGLDGIPANELTNPDNPMATLNILLENEWIHVRIYGHCIPFEVLVMWTIMAFDSLHLRSHSDDCYQCNHKWKLELLNLLTCWIQ